MGRKRREGGGMLMRVVGWERREKRRDEGQTGRKKKEGYVEGEGGCLRDGGKEGERNGQRRGK